MRDIDSTPPATITPAAPDSMRWKALTIAWIPEPQFWLTENAGTRRGRPAFSAATRAIGVDSAGCAMLPMITSSTTRGSRSMRASASPMVMRHSSSAGTSLKAPHDLQNGVRTPSTTTTPRRKVTGGPAARGGGG